MGCGRGIVRARERFPDGSLERARALGISLADSDRTSKQASQPDLPWHRAAADSGLSGPKPGLADPLASGQGRRRPRPDRGDSVALALGHVGDALAIAASIAFSVAFGFLTDWRAERPSRPSRVSLRRLPGSSVTERSTKWLRRTCAAVISPSVRRAHRRGGRPCHAARDLQVDESALTGESVPRPKHPRRCAPGAAARPLEHGLRGTTVVSGWGSMIVTGVRGETELARIGRLVAGQGEADPTRAAAEQLGRRLSLLAVGLSAAITLIGLLRGRPLWLMLETGVILAIAAIPEGLPAVTTSPWPWRAQDGPDPGPRASPGGRRNARCTSVICTDKTGTLTENTMRVTRSHLADRELEVTGSGYSPVGDPGSRPPFDPPGDPALRRLLEVAAICNDARLESHDDWHIHGSPTEGARSRWPEKGPGMGSPAGRSSAGARSHYLRPQTDGGRSQ